MTAPPHLPPGTAPPASSRPGPGAGEAHHPSPPAAVLPNPPGAEQAGRGGPHVCGADISLTATGIASSHGWTEIVGHNGITKLPLPGRVDALDRLAWSIYDLTKSADLVCVEQLTFSRETGGHGGAGERAGLYWLLIRLYQRHDVPVVDVPTATVKRYATGKGGAVKGAVIDAAARRWPAWETGGDDNRADAVVLMAAGRDALGHPLAAMPKPHRAALDAVTWPEVS